ncbi:MAG: CARDB domain-containing protein, partial [Phycisphaerales bacterium]
MHHRSHATSETLETLEGRQMLSVDLSATISSPTAGASWTTGVEIRTLVTVANSGTERVRDVGLSVYASTDGTFDSSDVLLGSRNLSTMSAGESDAEDVEFTISSAVAAGTYTIFAVIDPSGVFAETDEVNNVSAGVSVTIAGGGGGGGGDDNDGDDNDGGGGGDDDGDDDDNGGGGTGVSDAAVSITTASGTTMTLGREQRVLVNARNLGAFRIDPRVGVALYASTDGVFDANADTLLGSRTVTLHDPGESEIEDIEFVLPAVLGAGQFTLFAVIDRANQVTETNEANNVSEGVAVTFVAGGSPGGGTGADLTVTVTSPTAGGTMVLGRQQRVLALASNLGTTDTGTLPVVSLYASADATLDTSADTLLGARSLSIMSAGETELEDIEFVLPASLGAGQFTLFAVIDSSGLVSESDETNNTSAGVGVLFAASTPAP